MSTEKKNKVWKRSGIFDTYEEAAERKESLISGDKSADLATNRADLLVKIKRYGKGYNKFQVKYWHPDFVTLAKKKKRNK
jgi:hypothetical protein|tara:strand:+ start:1454 stop:1693 length:240 start_codon:yes stop_codon:yes gene_type:complete